MKKILSIALLTFSMNVMAGSNNFSGIAWQSGTYADDSLSSDVYPTVIMSKVGNKFDKNLAYELHLLTGIKPGEINVAGTNVDIGVGFSYGVFIKPMLPPMGNIRLYALFGYSKGTLSASAKNISISDSVSGASLGAGIEIKLNEDQIMFAEMVTYISDSDSSFNVYSYKGLNIGILF